MEGLGEKLGLLALGAGACSYLAARRRGARDDPGALLRALASQLPAPHFMCVRRTPAPEVPSAPATATSFAGAIPDSLSCRSFIARPTHSAAGSGVPGSHAEHDRSSDPAGHADTDDDVARFERDGYTQRSPKRRGLCRSMDGRGYDESSSHEWPLWGGFGNKWWRDDRVLALALGSGTSWCAGC